MPVNIFPPYASANEDGLIGVGGILTADSVWDAYQKGIFPWYGHIDPLMWWCPDPRFVLYPEKLHIAHSMRSLLGSNKFTFSLNQHFPEVIAGCRDTKRKGENGTWITPNMIDVYTDLFHRGKIISAECLYDGKLVGGLYGVKLPHIFCGESMFSTMSNASKFAFIHVVKKLAAEGVSLIDCQVYTPHLETLGAEMISREKFLSYLG